MACILRKQIKITLVFFMRYQSYCLSMAVAWEDDLVI